MNKVLRSTVLTLVALHVLIACAGFFSPHDPATSDRERPYRAPMGLHFLDDKGQFHLRPFFYAQPLQEDGRYSVADHSRSFGVQFFVHGAKYDLFGVLPCDLHLFGSSTEPLFLLGSDAYGRDQLSRILHGGQLSVLGAACGTALTLILGLFLGLIAGFYGGWIDAFLMRGAELISTLPCLYLLLALRAFLPLSVSPVLCFLLMLLVLAIVGSGRSARLVRAVVITARQADFVKAARGFGAGNLHLLRRHILPFTLSVILTQGALLIPQFVLTEIALSFLGLGVPEPAPSWGNLLVAIQQYSVMTVYWWMWLPLLVMLPFFAYYIRLAQLLCAHFRN